MTLGIFYCIFNVLILSENILHYHLKDRITFPWLQEFNICSDWCQREQELGALLISMLEKIFFYIPGCLLPVELCLLKKRHVDVLILGTSECDLVWK